MPTYDLTQGSAGVPFIGLNKIYTISNSVDLNAMAVKPISTDILKVLNIPAKTFVQNVIVEVVTQSAATGLTATVGDGADADGWDTAVDLEAAAGTATYAGFVLTEGTPNTVTDAYAGGKVYTAADTIDLVTTVNTVTTWGEIKVTAICAEL